jgi:hypothetical protein
MVGVSGEPVISWYTARRCALVMLGLYTTSTRVLSLKILAQAASIQVVSIVQRIKVLKIVVANFNALC